MAASESGKTAAAMKQWAIWYNQIPNLFWSVLSFTPLGYFWYTAMDLKWLLSSLALSLLAGFLPRAFFDTMHFGKTASVYKKIGIRFVKKYTQDGDWVNRLIRRKFPQYKVFDHSAPMQKHIDKAYAIEKIHFSMFIFFLLTAIYALYRGEARWAIIITINNLIFNLYPNFLQQYNRLRLRHLSRIPNASPLTSPQNP